MRRKDKLLSGKIGQPVSREQSIDELTKVLYTLPIQALFTAIETNIDVLMKRGVKLLDWDSKLKYLRQIRMVGGKTYFFACSDDGEEEDLTKSLQKQIKDYQKMIDVLQESNRLLQEENLVLRSKKIGGDDINEIT